MKKFLSLLLYFSLLTGPVAFVRSQITSVPRPTHTRTVDGGGGDPCDDQLTQIVYGILCGELGVCIAPCTDV